MTLRALPNVIEDLANWISPIARWLTIKTNKFQKLSFSFFHENLDNVGVSKKVFTKAYFKFYTLDVKQY